MGPMSLPAPHSTPLAQPGAGARPRAKRLAIWASAAAAALLAAGALASLARDDVLAHRDASDQARRARDLGVQLGVAHAQAASLDTQLSALRTQDAQLQAQLRNPTLAMWNSCGGPCAIGPGSVRVGSVPDTFELHLAFTADVAVRAYVLTFHQWTQFDDCGFSVRCVSGDYQVYGPGELRGDAFAGAEGCSGYVWVLQSDGSGTITPDVRVRYLPASQSTGVCAASP
jgi:hypothetical protein